jgi:hypothetical protein
MNSKGSSYEFCDGSFCCGERLRKDSQWLSIQFRYFLMELTWLMINYYWLFAKIVIALVYLWLIWNWLLLNNASLPSLYTYWSIFSCWVDLFPSFMFKLNKRRCNEDFITPTISKKFTWVLWSYLNSSFVLML